MKKKILIVVSIILVMSGLTGCKSVVKDFTEGFKEGFENGVKEVKEAEYNRGVWDGHSYKNESLGLSLELPENWSMASEKEMMAVMDSGFELLSEEDKKNYKFSKLKVINDFMVFGPDQMSNVQLVLENLSLSIGGSSMDEQAYIDLTIEQVKSLEGIEYSVGETYTDTVAGEEYLVLPAVANDVLVQKYYCRKIDNYMMAFVVTFPLENENEIEDFMDLIKAL